MTCQANTSPAPGSQLCMGNGMTYTYSPLAKASSDIRLLELKPDRWEAYIDCRLVTVSLDSFPAFEALSYVWGEKTPPGRIEIDGYSHTVTTNLEAALRHLRHETETRTLWVDALCINQVDTAERSEQVQKMHAIYTQATNVLAWTGAASNGSAEAIDLIRDVGQLFLENSIFGRNDAGQDRTLLPSKRLKQLGFSPESANWTAVWDFFERPYFSRVWVIQELAVRGYADDPMPCTLYCGTSQVDLLNFMTTGLFLLYYMVHGYVSDVTTGEMDPICRPLLPRAPKHPPALSMCQVMTPDLHHGYATLVPLTQVCRKFQATDDRDKIYALLGLCSRDDRSFRPDYAKPVRTVLMDFVKFFVRRDQNLHAIFSNRGKPCSAGPSWVPEIHPEHMSLNDMLLVAEFLVHNACGNRKAEADFDDDAETMTVKGVIIGTLEQVIGPWNDTPATTSPDASLKEVNALIHNQDASRQISALARKLRNTSRYNDFWRTLMHNKLQTLEQGEDITYPAPEEVGYLSRVHFRLELPPADFEPHLSVDSRANMFSMAFWKSFVVNITERTFFFTRGERYMGLGPYGAAPGDLAVVLYGSEYPFVLRPEGDRYRVIGTAYVHGVMDGELVREGSQAGERKFILC